MTQWEYRTEIIDTTGKYLVKAGYFPDDNPWHPDAESPQWSSINELGKEGWELVSVLSSKDYDGIAIFRRPILKEE